MLAGVFDGKNTFMTSSAKDTFQIFREYDNKTMYKINDFHAVTNYMSKINTFTLLDS